MPTNEEVLRNTRIKLHTLKELGGGLRVGRVLGDRVLIRTVTPLTELDEYKKKGIIIPQSVEKEYIPLSTTGIIVAVGDDVTKLKAGEMVMFARLSGMDFTISEQTLRIIQVKEILAVLVDTDESVVEVQE